MRYRTFNKRDMFGVNSKSIADGSRTVLQPFCSVHTVVERAGSHHQQ